MKIESLMTRQVRTCSPTDSLQTAARFLWEGDCGALPVVDDERRVVGMLTDRDVCMAAYLNGARLEQIAVGQAMAGKVHSLKSSAPVHDALEVMRNQQVRRVPVVDAQEKLVGLLSLADLVRAWASHRAVEGRELRADDVAYALSGICRDRREEPRAVMVVEVRPQAIAAKGDATADEGKAKPSRRKRAAKGRSSKPRKA